MCPIFLSFISLSLCQHDFAMLRAWQYFRLYSASHVLCWCMLLSYIHSPHFNIISYIQHSLYFILPVINKKYHFSHRIRGSSVSIVSDYGLDDRGSITGGGRGFFL
jgi:hypothetical protein